MRVLSLQLLRFASVASCLILAACNGGGGGGGGGGSGGSTNGLSLSTNAISFNAPNTSSTPASQIITATVTGVTSGTLYIKIVSTGPAVASITNITVTSSTTGQGTINPAPANILGAGVHTSTVTVYACTTDPNCSSGQLAGSPQTVSVTYTVTGVAASPSSLNYTIVNSPVTGDLSRQFTVTGYPNQNNWNAGSNVPWLSVLPASGNTGNAIQVTASLVQAQLDGMFNGTYAGSITITSSSGSTVSIPVTLTISRTQVNYVAPYIATSGVAEEVIIRGENFNQVAVQNVKFGGTNATTFNVISDTEIRATHLALSAGSYPVQLQNNLGINRSRADLVVVDAQGLSGNLSYGPLPPIPPGGVPITRRVIGLGYDAERKTVVVGFSYSPSGVWSNQIMYFVYTTQWSVGTAQSIPNLTSITLSIDGKQWLAGTDTGITQIDAANFSSGITTNHNINPSLGAYVKNLSPANDGNVPVVFDVSANFGLEAYRYNVRNPAFSDLGIATYHGDSAVSGDGSRVVIGSDAGQMVYQYNASSGTTTFTGLSLPVLSTPVLNRTGSRIVFNGTLVYDGSYSYLGALPNNMVPYYPPVVLSPNGTRAYVAEGSTLRTYDLSAPLVGGYFPQIAVITFSSDVGTDVKMIISPDGKTLFLAGKNEVVVYPVP
ncbi:IPT/TIG domain-containing protein [Sulfuricaulis sp.]|jgi:hypothetical protein|uniref:IPT/TIG domain-containing protein n=1 Tax=Sulfuricaulis sp. TaxID=2003553 RepID=UPI00355AC1FC